MMPLVATCSELRAWWDTLVALGQGLGYHQNAIKTDQIVKNSFLTKQSICLKEQMSTLATVQEK